MNLYENYIMEAVRQNMDLEEDDTSRDEEIMAMPKSEVFERWLEWEGIMGGYGEMIRGAIVEIWDGVCLPD